MTIHSTKALTKWYRPNCCRNDSKSPNFFSIWISCLIGICVASQKMFRPNMLSRALPFRVYIVTILKALIIIIETLVVKYQFWVKVNKFKGSFWNCFKWRWKKWLNLNFLARQNHLIKTFLILLKKSYLYNDNVQHGACSHS